jgi:polyisoprenoid-binding protein YceI
MRPLVPLWAVTQAAVATFAVHVAPTHVTGQEFHVDMDADNTVLFISRTVIEVVEGRTDRIDGYVVLENEKLVPGELSGPTGFYLEVDLASLDTRLGLRNRHMRNNYLEVEEFRYAFFEGTIQEVERIGRDHLRVWGVGSMEVHGVSRDMRIPCDLSSRGSGYRAQCSFELLLSDFDISIPRIMFLKLANEIRLELDFSVRPALDP